MKLFRFTNKKTRILDDKESGPSAVSKQAYLSQLLAMLLCFAFIPVMAVAQESSPKATENTTPTIDPKVDQLLQRMSKQLSSAPQLSVHADIRYDMVLRDGTSMEMSKSTDVLVKRPNRLWAQVVDDLGERRFWYNGKALTLQGVASNVYASKEISGTIGDMMDRVHEKLNVQTPIADLLVSDPYSNFKNNVDWAVYAGLHYLDGDYYHHLILGNDNIEGQIWLEDSTRGLPRRLSITSMVMEGFPRYTADFSDWSFTKPMTDAMFEFKPPPGAERIDFLPVTAGEVSRDK